MRFANLAITAALAFACAPAFAVNPATPTETASTKATTADIDRLLEVMDMQTMMAGMMQQMADSQRTMVVDAFGSDMSDAERTRMQGVLDKTSAIVQQELSWKAVEPLMRKVYTQVFSKKEVAAMIAFYSSPEGSSILQKSPQAMALTMQEMQPLMMTTMEKVKVAIDKAASPAND